MAKKDLDRWCKGKEGVEHHIEPTLARPLARLGVKCGLRGKKWSCVHARACTTCQRILTYEWQMTPGQCPDFKG